MSENTPQKLKRRANILYRLRKKGVRCDTRQKTIYFEYGSNPDSVIQIKRLRYEFDFNVQLEINQH